MKFFKGVIDGGDTIAYFTSYYNGVTYDLKCIEVVSGEMFRLHNTYYLHIENVGVPVPTPWGTVTIFEVEDSEATLLAITHRGTQ